MKNRLVTCLLVILFGLSACNSASVNPTTDSTTPVRGQTKPSHATTQDEHNPFRIMETIPEEFQWDVTLAEMFGREIYFQDIAAWVSTDFIVEKNIIETDRRLRGWITEHVQIDEYTLRTKVIFVGLVNNQLKNLYEMEVEDSAVIKHSFKAHADGIDLDELTLLRYKARQTALQSDFMRCSESYNTAVITFTNQDTQKTIHKVYLLPGTSEHGVIPAGGNHEVTLDESGETIEESIALSKSCITLAKQEGTVALALSHLTTATPTAVHVFHSILYDIPLYILTEDNDIKWLVKQGEISLIE